MKNSRNLGISRTFLRISEVFKDFSVILGIFRNFQEFLGIFPRGKTVEKNLSGNRRPDYFPKNRIILVQHFFLGKIGFLPNVFKKNIQVCIRVFEYSRILNIRISIRIHF
jgi:hypothetical protein